MGQEIVESLMADTYYLLQAAIGHRADQTLSTYDLGLFAGDVELTLVTMANSTPFEGTWTDASRIYQVGCHG